MDVNKEVDRLEKAVKRNDGDAAIESDSRLAVFEKQVTDGLTSMPKEHAETISFYFRDWIMRTFDEVVYILIIILGFNVTNNDFASFLLIGVGAALLLGTFVSRLSYQKFCAGDMERMRKEKIIANNYKMQLNYVRQSRAEHSKYIDRVLEEKMRDVPMTNIFSNIFKEIREKQTDVHETQKDSENNTTD